MRYKQLAVKLFVIAIFASVGYFNIGGCGSSGDSSGCDLAFGVASVDECAGSALIFSCNTFSADIPFQCQLFNCDSGCTGPDCVNNCRQPGD